MVILDNCEHVVDAAAALAERLLDAAPGLRLLCTSQVALEIDGEAVFELAPLALADAVELFTRRATRSGDPREVHELCRSLDGLPLAIELAAARTKTLSIEQIARRLDDRFGVLSDPTSRKPERRRALKATIAVELRAALSRRPARPVGAGHVRGRRIPAGGRVGARRARRAPVGGDRRGRAPGEPFARDRRRRRCGGAALPAARQHPRVRARSDGGRGADRPRPRRARRVVRHRRRVVDRGRAQRPPGRAPVLRPHGARQHRRRTGLERRARAAARARHRQRVRLGLDRPRRQPRRATDPGRARCRGRRGAGPGPRRRAAARGLDRGVDGPSRAGPPPRRRRRRAGRRERRRRSPGALQLLPRLRRVASRRVGACARADGAQPGALRRARSALGSDGERALRRQGRDLGRRPRSRRRSP